jgi:hypothetical protein
MTIISTLPIVSEATYTKTTSIKEEEEKPHTHNSSNNNNNSISYIKIESFILREKKKQRKDVSKNGNKKKKNIRAHYTKQSVYTHTLTKKENGQNEQNVDARIKYLQLFCVTQYFFFPSMYIYI